jgi:hypothetical protein
VLRLALVLLACCGPAASPAPAAPATPAPAAPSTWPVPSGWKSEVIPFPLDFAPSLTHRGVEELRFPPGMFDPAAPGYWSYAFVWRLDDAAQLDARALGDEVTVYFRGLVAAVDDKHRIADRDAITATATADGSRFRLRVHTFDAFKTAQPIELDGWAERRTCGTGSLWIFVLARQDAPLRGQLDALAASAQCGR